MNIIQKIVTVRAAKLDNKKAQFELRMEALMGADAKFRAENPTAVYAPQSNVTSFSNMWNAITVK